MSILFLPDTDGVPDEPKTWFISKRGAKRAHIDRTCTKRPMTIKAPTPLPPDFELCPKCVPVPPQPPPPCPDIHTFRCVSGQGLRHNVTIETATGHPNCDCNTFLTRGTCPHVDFVLTRVVCAPRDLVDTLREYGDLDTDEVQRLLECIKTSKRRQGRFCAACRQEMVGIDVEAVTAKVGGDPRCRHWFHTECATRLGLFGNAEERVGVGDESGGVGGGGGGGRGGGGCGGGAVA